MEVEAGEAGGLGVPEGPSKQLIVLIDDDETHVRLTEQRLVRSGYVFDSALNGTEGTGKALQPGVSLVILDLILPPTSGIDVLKAIRAKSAVPILVLSARSEVKIRVQALKLGADDYLNKPFDKEELLARIEALLRRTQERETTLTIGDLVLDRSTREVRRGARSIELSPTEYRLLEYFMQHEGEILTREQLIQQVWGYDFDPGTNILSVYVSYLRRAIDDGHERKLIATVRGEGFRIG